MSGSSPDITFMPLNGSMSPALTATHPRAMHLGTPESGRRIRLLVVLKPSTPFSLPCQPLSRDDYCARHATSAAAIERVKTHASRVGLGVERESAEAHMLVLTGTVGSACALFKPDQLHLFQIEKRECLVREGHLHAPHDIADDLVAIMGFDQRTVAKPHFLVRPHASTSATSYTPVQVAQRYGFPAGTGTGQTIGLIELGGGYTDTQMAAYFSSIGVDRTGTLTAVPVSGGSNAPDNDPSGADGEVQLDIQVAGSVAPEANLAVYFAPNQNSGFYEAITAAVHDTTNAPDIVSISWGGPESSWSSQDMNAMDQAFQSAATLGITVFAASGDNGADDGTSAAVVDFPASSPHVVGCGGTSLPKSGTEVAWNDGAQGGSTGGGYSSHFSKPSWQTPNTKTGRGVPDVAGNADPETGYVVMVDGTQTVIGGTSAVAPLWAGLLALCNAASGKKPGLITTALYPAAADFNDITSGNNDGYSAARGWDPVTGLGSPKGAAIAATLAGS